MLTECSAKEQHSTCRRKNNEISKITVRLGKQQSICNFKTNCYFQTQTFIQKDLDQGKKYCYMKTSCCLENCSVKIPPLGRSFPCQSELYFVTLRPTLPKFVLLLCRKKILLGRHNAVTIQLKEICPSVRAYMTTAQRILDGTYT